LKETNSLLDGTAISCFAFKLWGKDMTKDKKNHRTGTIVLRILTS
jgi:hypothetical protein